MELNPGSKRPVTKHPNRLSLVLALAIAASAIAMPASACKVNDVLTPTELVKEADGIYHVRAEAYATRPDPSKPPTSPVVRFSVLAAIKGAEQKADFNFVGVLVDRNDPNDTPVPYDIVRSAGRHGDCFAKQYRAGGEYLMFIKSGTPYWSALAPTNEQVRGESDPWLVWVRNAVAKDKPAQ